MAVGFPPEDFAEEASLAHAESADSPGQMHSTAILTRSVSRSLAHSLTHTLTLSRVEHMACPQVSYKQS